MLVLSLRGYLIVLQGYLVAFEGRNELVPRVLGRQWGACLPLLNDDANVMKWL